MPLTVVDYRQMTLTCDGPRCKMGKDETPKTVAWTLDAKTAESGEVPDDVYRFLPLGPMVGQERAVTFCSPGCLRDFMRSYVPQLSPREIEEQRKRNAEVEAKKAAEQMDLPTTAIEPEALVLKHPRPHGKVQAQALEHSGPEEGV